ncbi:MAG: ATP-binding cassette domain-containing protein [Phycisphaerae bacterium]|jgi:ABC-2 type transport system ATP-binding protein
MIRVRELRKSYGSYIALDGVSFDVAKGTTFGFLGPNGAGKTTAISIMCGLLRADGGSVSLGGKSDPSKMDVRAGLSVVPQALAIYEELSARENLSFFGKMCGLGGSLLAERIDYCLELAGLKERSFVQTSKFSGGMKRRLNLACSLINDPDIILLDEPTVGVDPQSRNSIFQTIDAFKAQGKTVVYTTHYMEEAQRLCDNILILDKGKVLAAGTLNELIEEHGGTSYIEAEMTRELDDAAPLTPFILGKNVQLNGNILRFETNEPMKALAQLNQSGYRFVSIKTGSPTLEEVFLNLTGKSLRD